MKKGEIYEGLIEKIEFPNKGIAYIDGEKVVIKNTVPGQKVRFLINKKRKGKCEARVTELLERSPSETRQEACIHFESCGGCIYQTLPYEEQLKLKEEQVKGLLNSVCPDLEFEGVIGSPVSTGYRNKMEFSFGDEFKDGPLALGLHKKGSFYDIVNVGSCNIVDKDFNDILDCVWRYFSERDVCFYKKMQHTGFLRHLLVRKGIRTEEILIDLVTTTQQEMDFTDLVQQLLGLELKGNIVGILNTLNDSLADVVQNDKTVVLYGKDYFYEELLGLKFKISPFSFFQTNSLGAEVLYRAAREYVGETKDKVIFDLYSGTGTIAQILAPVAKKVIGVEIVEEAVEAARENTRLNGLENCEFIVGDVLKVIDGIEEKPDLIVLDPPRDGIHPKALDKIIDFGVERIVYISCKPTSLVRDLAVFQERGYEVVKGVGVDMFPMTGHVETVVLMSQKGGRKTDK